MESHIHRPGATTNTRTRRPNRRVKRLASNRKKPDPAPISNDIISYETLSYRLNMNTSRSLGSIGNRRRSNNNHQRPIDISAGRPRPSSYHPRLSGNHIRLGGNSTSCRRTDGSYLKTQCEQYILEQ